MECGADGCLTKPFRLDSLLDRIVAIVGNSSGKGNGNGDLSHGAAAAA
jgi:DNA-binding response OmpR family regulator